MTGARMPTPAELDTALWLDGRAAIEVAEAAHGAPGWPPLLQLLAGGGWREVPLVDAQADRELGWPLDGYMYPVPRARVERHALSMRWPVSTFSQPTEEHARVSASLRGEAEPLRRVAIELATADRRAVAS